MRVGTEMIDDGHVDMFTGIQKLLGESLTWTLLEDNFLIESGVF